MEMGARDTGRLAVTVVAGQSSPWAVDVVNTVVGVDQLVNQLVGGGWWSAGVVVGAAQSTSLGGIHSGGP